jgi:hypothetical protein
MARMLLVVTLSTAVFCCMSDPRYMLSWAILLTVLLDAWYAGYVSGLRVQLLKSAGADSGEKTRGQQQQPSVVGESLA